MSEHCVKCDGCGKIADSDEGEPIDCPECMGKGTFLHIIEQERAGHAGTRTLRKCAELRIEELETERDRLRAERDHALDLLRVAEEVTDVHDGEVIELCSDTCLGCAILSTLGKRAPTKRRPGPDSDELHARVMGATETKEDNA